MPRHRFPQVLLLFLIALQLTLPLPASGPGHPPGLHPGRQLQRPDSWPGAGRGRIAELDRRDPAASGTGSRWKEGTASCWWTPRPRSKGPAFDHERLAATLAALPALARTPPSPPSPSPSPGSSSPTRRTPSSSSWPIRPGAAAWTTTSARTGEPPGRAREEGVEAGIGPSGVTWTAGPGQLWRNLSTEPILSPDSTMEASIQNYNVAVRKVGDDEFTMLSFEGTEGNPYTNRSLRLVPGLQEDRRVPGAPGHATGGPPGGVLPRRPGAAQALDPSLRQTRRRPGQGDPGDLRRGVGTPDDRGRRPLPQRLHASPIWSGGRTAGTSPSSTTSGATRSTGSSRWMPRPGPPGP